MQRQIGIILKIFTSFTINRIHFVIETPDDDKLKLFRKYLQLIFDKVKIIQLYNFKISYSFRKISIPIFKR